jgi:hypothetical protein
MLFHERYELLALRGGNKELALPGREITTGRAVLVHLMAAGYTPENQELLQSIDHMSAEDRKLILESGDHEGIPYVVTEMLPRDQALREWVAASLTTPSPPVTTERLSQGGVWKVPIAREANPRSAPPAAPPPPAAGSEPGEFTRLFQSAQSPASGDRAAAEPGEFTRLFRSAAGSEEASTVADVEAATEPSRDEAVTATMALPVLYPDKPPDEPAPGEFTRVLQGQAPAPAPALKPPTPPPEPAPGEFTRLLHAEPERRATSEGESTRVFQAPPPSPPPPLPPSAQGEFTRMMQSPLAPGPMRSTPPAAPQATPGGFTQMLKAGDPASLPPRPPEPPKPTGSVSKGGGFQAPGEFTRMFGSEPQAREEMPSPQAPLPFLQGGAATGAFERRATPAAAKAGPSEYTQMFSSPAPAPPQVKAPAAPQSAAAAPPPAKSYLPLVLMLAGLFVVALIVILVLVLTK